MQSQLLQAKDLQTGIWKDEFQFLLKQLGNSSVLVSSFCFQILIKLVEQETVLDTNTGIQYVLNSLPNVSKDSLSTAISTLIDLVLFLNFQKKKKQQQITENSITDPLYSAFKSRSECLPEILSQMNQFCAFIESNAPFLAGTMERSKLIEDKQNFLLKRRFTFYFKSLISYILLENAQQVNFTIKSIMLSNLAKIASSSKLTELCVEIVEILVGVLPSFNSLSAMGSLEISFVYEFYLTLLQTFSSILLNNNGEFVGGVRNEISALMNKILVSLLSLLGLLRSMNKSCQIFLELLLQLIIQTNNNPSILNDRKDDILNVVLGWLLLGSVVQSEYSILLQIFSLSLQCSKRNQVIDRSKQLSFVFLLYPLIELCGSSVSKNIKSTATNALNSLELLIKAFQQQNANQVEENEDHQQLYPFSSGICGVIYTTFSCYRSLFFNSSAANLVEFTSSIEERISSLNKKPSNSPSHALTQHIIGYFIAPLLFHTDPILRTGFCNLISAFSAKSPFQAISLLPLVVYKLATEQDSEVLTNLFYCLPNFANDFECVPLVTKCLQPLLDSPKTQSLGIRLFEKLWEKQTRLFPRLLNLIESYSADKQPIETRISIATCILDVCQKRPEKGADLVSIISRIIKQEKHPSVLAIAVESLSILCNEDVLEFQTAWAVLSKSFSNNKQLQPIVMASWLKFLSCGAREANEEEGIIKYFNLKFFFPA